MKPQHTLGRATTPDGKEVLLHERGGAYAIRVGGLELMSSRAHGSEEALAQLALNNISSQRPVVLVGGLGMGFTLRAVLEKTPASAQVVVVEILEAVVDWNRTHLAHLAGKPLEDPRVTILTDDVGAVLKRERHRFDVVLLDVDNGPEAFTSAGNHGLYTDGGLQAIRRALRPKGVLGVWSADPDRGFERRLAHRGFRTTTHSVPARRGGKGPKHTVFIARVR
jgi:spermidine synthase